MRSLVLGQGQIGEAVTSVINGEDEVIIFDDRRGTNEPPILRDVDVMHVCFPCADQEEFVKAIQAYVAKYMPAHIIIWSTVPIGTTKLIPGAVHSPVEGRHPKLEESIRNMARWIGYNDRKEGGFFIEYFEKLHLVVKVVPKSDFTEFLKLRSTSKFGINLVWADYEAGVAKDLGMEFDLLKEFDEDYNKLYHNIGMDWAQRYIIDAPHGHIGGHCVVPNAELLDEQYPNDMLKMIKRFK